MDNLVTEEFLFNIPKMTIETKSINPNLRFDISTYSSFSTYEDDIWFLDNYYKKLNCDNTLRKIDFSKFKKYDKYSCVKKYIYANLLRSKSLKSLNKIISFIKYFTAFIKSKGENSLYDDVKPLIIENYYEYLKRLKLTNKVKSDRWSTIKDFYHFNGFYEISIQMEKYLFQRTVSQKSEDKYISDYVTTQLDKIMMDDSQPVNHRTLYWILRLYPCRCTETLSTSIDCLKPYADEIQIFSSIVFKTSGGNENGSPKLLLIDSKEPIQKMLLDLIMTQKKIAEEVYEKKPELGNFLFLSPIYKYYKATGKYKIDKRYTKGSLASFNKFLSSIIKRYNILEEDGTLAIITSHKFRHKSITDRIESKLFRPIDLLPMTLHANTKMITNTYHHPQDAVKKAENVHSFITGETVIFKGKVINSKNDKVFERFLKNPYSYSLKDMGICTDIRDCSKTKFECLGCDYFIPDCSNLDYFEYHLIDWENKYQIALKKGNVYMQDNAKYNIKLHRKVIDKINKAINEGVKLNEKNR